MTTTLFSLPAGVKVGAEATTWQYGHGLRFTNITIPKGSTISQASMTFRCEFGTSGVGSATRISAEDVDDAITFADDAAAFDTRWAARTTARMDWDGIAATTTDVDFNSITTDGVTTFASIIQEVIDRAGWASGQDMVIFWDDFDDRSTHANTAVIFAYSYDGSAEFAPKLVITYTEGAATVPKGGSWWVLRR